MTREEWLYINPADQVIIEAGLEAIRAVFENSNE